MPVESNLGTMILAMKYFIFRPHQNNLMVSEDRTTDAYRLMPINIRCTAHFLRVFLIFLLKNLASIQHRTCQENTIPFHISMRVRCVIKPPCSYPLKNNELLLKEDQDDYTDDIRTGDVRHDVSEPDVSGKPRVDSRILTFLFRQHMTSNRRLNRHFFCLFSAIHTSGG